MWSILATAKFHDLNDDSSVPSCISRTDIFLQNNCEWNRQSLFKDFVKLLPKLVMSEMEQFKKKFWVDCSLFHFNTF